MKITEIIPITKQKYRILTDEQPAFVLYRGELSHYRLEEGGELPQEIFEQIQQEILIKRAKLRAMHLLTRMDYTEAELLKKLQQGGYTPKAVEEAMNYVRSYHYLDDERYAAAYLRTYGEKKSRRQMEFELARKGVSKEMIASCMEECGEQDETEKIRSILQKRCKNPKEADEKEKQKHYGYLMRKGFSSGEIFQVFQEFF